MFHKNGEIYYILALGRKSIVLQCQSGIVLNIKCPIFPGAIICVATHTSNSMVVLLDILNELSTYGFSARNINGKRVILLQSMNKASAKF